MAVISGTTQTYDVGAAGGNREDLEDVIYDLFPMDTYLLTNLEDVEATSTYHEWLTDSLAGATANRQIEGDDASFVTVGAPTRMGNYTQITRKTWLISGTQETVKKAGRKSELARQKMKKMREWKRDVELALIGAQASSAGGAGTARSSGGMESWIASTDHGAGLAGRHCAKGGDRYLCWYRTADQRDQRQAGDDRQHGGHVQVRLRYA
jgi:hypothetical protein